MTPICIAGMHRSGTSATAQLLHRCGVYLGDEDVLMEAAPDNPDGFWEDTRFVALNDAILGAFGGAWDYPPSLGHGWTEDERLNSARRDAEALLADCGKQSAVWGWKDPRNSLTFPFWQRYFPDLKVVFCLRNPLAVAHSLFARSHHSYVFGLNMWYRYNRAFFDAVPPDQRIVTAYDAYFGGAPAELARVLAFLGVIVPIAARNRALSALSSELRHHTYTEQDLHETGVSAEVIDLYARLREEAGLQAGPVEPGPGIATIPGQRSTIDDATPVLQPARAQHGERGIDAAPSSNSLTPLPPEGIGQIDHRAMETTRLRFEIKDVRAQFSTLEATYRTLEHEHHDLEHELHAVRTEYDELATYCGKLDQELANRHTARSETDSYIRTLEGQRAALDDERAHTARYVQNLTEQLHNLKGNQAQTSDYVRTLEEQLVASGGERERIADYMQILEAQLAAMKDEQGRIGDYAQRLAEQIATSDRERERVADYVRILEEQITASGGEREHVADYVRVLEEHIAALKDEQEQTDSYVRLLEER